MFRSLAIFVFAAACSSKPAANNDPALPATGAAPTRIAVPGATGAAPATPPPPKDDARFQLQADEGTLTIDKAEGKAGADLVANIKVTPAAGRHVSMEFPIKVTLEPTDGVTLAKTELQAGGNDKSQGDASAFSEQLLAFAVHATATKPGSYEVKGMMKFGVCDAESCHPKKQPITIAVAAN